MQKRDMLKLRLMADRVMAGKGKKNEVQFIKKIVHDIEESAKKIEEIKNKKEKE